MSDSESQKEADKSTTSPGFGSSPHDVDVKIAQQLQEFESLSDSKKKTIGPVSSAAATTVTVSVKAPVSLPPEAAVAPQQLHHPNPPGVLWDKPHGMALERFSVVLEDVKESEEEWTDSPKKSPMRSPQRAMLEKGASLDMQLKSFPAIPERKKSIESKEAESKDGVASEKKDEKEVEKEASELKEGPAKEEKAEEIEKASELQKEGENRKTTETEKGTEEKSEQQGDSKLVRHGDNIYRMLL